MATAVPHVPPEVVRTYAAALSTGRLACNRPSGALADKAGIATRGRHSVRSGSPTPMAALYGYQQWT